MGTGTSNPSGVAPVEMVRQLRRSEADIVNLMLPVYYTTDPVSQDDYKRANFVWDMIIDDTAPNFLRLKVNGNNSFGTCVMFFYDTFYNRLFDVHPLCRSMFKSGMKTQGKFLVKMITMLVKDIDDPKKFNDTLVKLAETHNQRGVKSIEYGIIGEVMFWTLREVLGRETFDKNTHTIWIRIFSRILSVVVPVAVSYEIKTGGTNQQARVNAEKDAQRKLIESEVALSQANSRTNSNPSSRPTSAIGSPQSGNRPVGTQPMSAKRIE